MTQAKPLKTPSKPTVKEQVEQPASNFDAPQDVLEDDALTRSQKAKVLRRWEEDARRLSVATEEGMSGGEPSRVTEVADAQVELSVVSRKSKSPSKAG